LTILGIILFLRLGYVVGSAGLARCLLMLALANGISVLTSLSLAAIATNLKVKRGGDYYLISRTLGHEFGGAIGIVLFLAQSVSIAFYCIGFGEAAADVLPMSGADAQLIAASAVGVLFVFAWLGTDWATRFQYLVMAVLGISLASFFAGGVLRWDPGQLAANWPPPADGPPFWVLFALLFPAVTGFTQGVSMSGELKDPGRSLPLGTFLAIGVSILVYFFAAVVFAAALPREQLLHDYAAMNRVAVFDWLIVAGVAAATLSSAMASFLGAPRILQALAADRLFPALTPFARGDGPHANPRRGVLLSLVIALATVGLGKLNLVAPVVTMFFLISYGLINYATFFETQAASPSFRPRFHFYDLRLSLAGAAGCLAAMLAIDATASLAAIAVLFAVYQYLKRTAHQARWADGRRSYHLQRLRTHLLAAGMEADHPRDWRPNLLLFSDDSRHRVKLLRFASWIEADSGLTTAVRVLEGEGRKMLKRKAEVEAELEADIKQEGVDAFPLAVVAPSLDIGIYGLVQGFGIGPLRVNTILLNWVEHLPANGSRLVELKFGRHLRTAFRLGCNLVVLDSTDAEWQALETIPPEQRRIDVWWCGDASSRLMLLLAYLMTRTEAWEDATIRLFGACRADSTAATVEALDKMLDEVRIDAEPHVVADADAAAIAGHSADASLVFVPMRLQGNRPVGPFGGDLEALLGPLPVVALVLAAKDIDLDAEPEDNSGSRVDDARPDP
jgi:amino acid transporter